METLASTTRLQNGVEIPWLGLGTWQAQAGEETYNAVRDALDIGYRHIDTAKIYMNERDVGRAIRDHDVGRDQIFVTTKLWNSDQGYDATLRACDASLNALGLTYVDLYLIHWPEPQRLDSWRAMTQLLREGKCRAIGVSNFTISHLEQLLQSSEVPPAVNQVEFHPFLYQEELLDFCVAHHIQLEAYSPLTRGEKLGHAAIAGLAKRYGVSPAQIFIRWALEHGVVVIPKSTKRERIVENSRVFGFSLAPEDVRMLDSLDEGFRTCWDPTRMR